MLEDAKLYLKKKAAELDFERADVLQTIQTALDATYPGKTRAKSLNEGVLKVITTSSVVASELRLHQPQLIKHYMELTGRPIDRINIQITDLN